jgi:hypothetical protein
MSYRPIEAFRKQHVSVICCWRKSDRKWTDIRFCVKIVNKDSEMVALSALAYGQYAVETRSVLRALQRKGQRRARWPKKWAAKTAKDRCKFGQSTNLVTPRI